MNIQEELKKWAEESVKEYHSIASRKEVNIAYYTQSDLSILSGKPELMIVGINPGNPFGKPTYTEQCNNKNWSYLSNNPLDKNHLLKGNYCREKDKPSSWENHRKWGYWKGLKRCLSQTNLNAIIDDDNKIVVTNASFFSTKAADGISESLLIETIPYTLKLIKITKPKHLIFLSGRKCFERLLNLSRKSNIIQFEYKHICGNIYIGLLNNRFCIGIPHPAYKTSEELNLVASVLPHLVNAENFESVDIASIQKECATQIKDFEERIKTKADKSKEHHHIDKTNIVRQVISSSNLEVYEEKNHRYKLNGKYGITITSTGKGYIAIRHIKYDSNGYANIQDEEVLAIKKILKRRGYNTSEKVWIGTKLFSQFGNNDNEIIERICKEIKELKEEIQKI